MSDDILALCAVILTDAGHSMGAIKPKARTTNSGIRKRSGSSIYGKLSGVCFDVDLFVQEDNTALMQPCYFRK